MYKDWSKEPRVSSKGELNSEKAWSSMCIRKKKYIDKPENEEFDVEGLYKPTEEVERDY